MRARARERAADAIGCMLQSRASTFDDMRARAYFSPRRGRTDTSLLDDVRLGAYSSSRRRSSSSSRIFFASPTLSLDPVGGDEVESKIWTSQGSRRPAASSRRVMNQHADGDLLLPLGHHAMRRVARPPESSVQAALSRAAASTQAADIALSKPSPLARHADTRHPASSHADTRDPGSSRSSPVFQSIDAHKVRTRRCARAAARVRRTRKLLVPVLGALRDS